MKLHNFICFNISVLITLLNLCLPSKSQTLQDVSQKPRRTFVCEKYQGVPTTVAKTGRGTIPILGHIRHSGFFSDSGFDPSARCDIISGRFQKLHSQGELNFITSGKVRDLLVICGVRVFQQLCSSDNILFSLPLGSTTEDSIRIVEKLSLIGTNSAVSNPIYDTDFSIGLHGDPTTPPPPPPVKPFVIVDYPPLDDDSIENTHEEILF